MFLIINEKGFIVDLFSSEKEAEDKASILQKIWKRKYFVIECLSQELSLSKERNF